jgi:hypothetical protein
MCDKIINEDGGSIFINNNATLCIKDLKLSQKEMQYKAYDFTKQEIINLSKRRIFVIYEITYEGTFLEECMNEKDALVFIENLNIKENHKVLTVIKGIKMKINFTERHKRVEIIQYQKPSLEEVFPDE